MKIEDLKNKKIVILGFGREGRDNYLALRKLFPKKILGIADQMEKRIFQLRYSNLIKKDRYLKLNLGQNYLSTLSKYEIIIKSPGIPKKVLCPFLKKGQKVTSQTEIFLENCPGLIVGVTGTKGKGTTSCLIYQILKKGGLKARLVGNIGKPVFQLLLRARKNEIFVYELSSYQLENLKRSPQIAVFLNIFPEHLDYYKNFQEYLRAKLNIFYWQKKEDFLIYSPQPEITKEVKKHSQAKKIPLNPQVFKKIKFKKIPLLGEHNLLNIEAAYRVGEILKIPKEKIKKAIENFKPLPHRLEFVGKYQAREFYNDSLATVPQATISALKALNKKVSTLILGGVDRNLDFSNLAQEILKQKVNTLILFPQTGQKIWQEILKFSSKKNLPKAFFTSSLREAIKIAYQETKRQKVCLLSPAGASFNLFSDYRERGNLFKKLVKKYGQTKKSTS